MANILQKLPMYQQSWFRFTFILIKDYIHNRCSQTAASLTYTTLLSLIPIITVLLVIIAFIPVLEPAREQVYSYIYNNLMPESGIQVKQYISNFAEKSINLTTVGILVLFYTTISTLLKIEMAFNGIWKVGIYKKNNNKNSLHSLLFGVLFTIARYLFIIFLVPIVLAVAFIASSAIDGLNLLQQLDLEQSKITTLFHFDDMDVDWSWLTSVGTVVFARSISLVFTAIGFAAMYWFVPKAKVNLKSAIISGLVIALLFEGLRFIFGWTISKFTSFATIYGAFAVLPVLILWINLSWNLILMGVEISYCLTNFTHLSKQMDIKQEE